MNQPQAEKSEKEGNTMELPRIPAEVMENFRAAANDRLAELERQIATLQHLIAELLTTNQQLRERTRASD